MDVSPKTLREVEFREKMRGYHPEDVDQFLERVAAGIEVLQDRLRQAIERAQRAEQAATEAGGNDDALRRTLLLAQRTADLAVQEGRDQAARIVAAAEQQAQSLVAESEQRVHAMVAEAEHRAQATLAEAERRSQSMVNDAEQLARRGHEDALVEVRAELAKLEATRQRIQMDIDSLSRWIADHRNQLRAALEDALTRVDHISSSAPPASGAPYPAAGAVASKPPTAPAPAAVASPAWSNDAGPPTIWAPPPPDVVTPEPAAVPDVVAPEVTAAPSPPKKEAIAWQPDGAAGDEEGGDSDPYFAELRRAISDGDTRGAPPEGDPQAAGGAGGHAEN
jgi:cell division initiation protein